MNYRMGRTSRLISFVGAVLITASINSALLWTFESVAQDASNGQSAVSQLVTTPQPGVKS